MVDLPHCRAPLIYAAAKVLTVFSSFFLKFLRKKAIFTFPKIYKYNYTKCISMFMYFVYMYLYKMYKYDYIILFVKIQVKNTRKQLKHPEIP